MKKNTAKKIIGGLGFFILLLSMFISAVTMKVSSTGDTLKDTVYLGDVPKEDLDVIHQW